MELDTVDKNLLNLLQRDFPLSSEPFAVLGARLGIAAAQVIRRVRALKDGDVIRWISGVFDSSKLGYQSTLVAMHVPDQHLDAAAAVISAHRSVGHNYGRDHYYNLWFTLTLPEAESAATTIAQLADLAGAQATMSLPALRVFKRRVYFDMVATDAPETHPDQASESTDSLAARQIAPLSALDRDVIIELQADLPLKERPFDDLASHLGRVDAPGLLGQARSLRDRGLLRRYGASLNHQNAGFSVNAMACWSVPPALLDQAGRTIASYRSVSHCYNRETNANWPHNLFAMIHARSRDECEAVIQQVSSSLGISDYVALYTTKEYKKERVRYFSNHN